MRDVNFTRHAAGDSAYSPSPWKMTIAVIDRVKCPRLLAKTAFKLSFRRHKNKLVSDFEKFGRAAVIFELCCVHCTQRIKFDYHVGHALIILI